MDHDINAKHIALGLLAVAAIVIAPARMVWGEEKAAGKGDAILADLKVVPKLEWMSDGGDQPPALQVEIVFSGSAAERASQVWHFRLDSVLDEKGKSYTRRCIQSGMWYRQPNPPGTRHDGFRISNRPAIQTISELRGSVMMQTAGQRQEVVLENAFKTSGKPIQDKTLAALGIEVTAKITPKVEWQDPESEFAEHVTVVAKYDRDRNAKEGVCKVVGMDVLDKKGEVPQRHWGRSEDGTSTTYSFGCNERISREAKLRLVVHKGSRDVRVPFALTNIAVPPVPADMDRRAVPSEDMVEAEALPPSDPILTGLKMKVEPITEGILAGAIAVLVEGKPVEIASRYGEVSVDRGVDGTGRDVDLESSPGQMALRLGGSGFQGNQLVAYVWPAELPMPKRLRELRGSLSLRTGGQLTPIVVKEVLEEFTRPIENKTLKGLGTSVRLRDNKRGIEPSQRGMVESYRIEVVSKRDIPIYSLDLLDGRGSPIKVAEEHVFVKNNTLEWECFYNKELPADAQLRIVVHTNSRKVRVPFAFKDVTVPEIKNEDSESPATTADSERKDK